jgi:hypothetical protein
MSGLKIGDIVMVGGTASAEDRARNAGRFRTIIRFVPKGTEIIKINDRVDELTSDHAEVDGVLWSQYPFDGSWIEDEYKAVDKLVKINPDNTEDEVSNEIGKPQEVRQLELV